MRTYWWKSPAYPNLGDEITDLLLTRLYSQVPVHAPLQDATFAATGSLLGWVLDGSTLAGREEPLSIVGSGFMSIDSPVVDAPFARIHSVRGYISKNKLGGADSSRITVGDPGLLVPHILREQAGSPGKESKFAVVLHHRHSDNVEVRARFAHLDVKFVDIRTTDIDAFVAELRTAEYVLSQSLHGLIIADAVGIPNAWLELGPIHSGGAFKFLDYFSSTGRPAYLKVSGVPTSGDRIVNAAFAPDSARIAYLQKVIDQAFRDALQ